jgi:hypothetical protein
VLQGGKYKKTWYESPSAVHAGLKRQTQNVDARDPTRGVGVMNCEDLISGSTTRGSNYIMIMLVGAAENDSPLF